jgi:predicted nucleic acid-binding protein
LNVVDSSSWLEYFANGSNADFFEPAILDVDQLIVPSISIYEVFKRLLQQRSQDDALDAISIMMEGFVVGLDAEIALMAARLSLETRLSMADSIILATAQAYGATLWTQDSDFRDIQGVRYIEK